MLTSHIGILSSHGKQGTIGYICTNMRQLQSSVQQDLGLLMKHIHAAGDMESEKCHLSGIIIRDLSCTVSNYRSTKTLDQYLKEQNVLGALSCLPSQ